MRKIYQITGAALLVSCLPLLAQQPDNTAANKRDREKSEMTADQQSNRKPAVHVSSEIRKSLMADKSLSTYAHNVKIITTKGIVTLKGPVRSEEEKAAVVAKATEVAGAGNVKDELSVAAPKPSKKKSQSPS